MSGKPFCGSESPPSVTVDDGVTSSSSGTDSAEDSLCLLLLGLAGVSRPATHCLLLSLRFGDCLNVVSQSSLCRRPFTRDAAHCFCVCYFCSYCFFGGARAGSWVLASGACFFLTSDSKGLGESSSPQYWTCARVCASVRDSREEMEKDFSHLARLEPHLVPRSSLLRAWLPAGFVISYGNAC